MHFGHFVLHVYTDDGRENIMIQHCTQVGLQLAAVSEEILAYHGAASVLDSTRHSMIYDGGGFLRVSPAFFDALFNKKIIVSSFISVDASIGSSDIA